MVNKVLICRMPLLKAYFKAKLSEQILASLCPSSGVGPICYKRIPSEGESGIDKGVEESADQNGDRISDRELQ